MTGKKLRKHRGRQLPAEFGSTAEKRRKVVEGMSGESAEIEAELRELRTRRSRLQGELATMLITKQTSREALERLDNERDGLTDQVTGMLSELDQIRADAKQLVSDRRQLEVYVSALRKELQALQSKRGDLIQEIRELDAEKTNSQEVVVEEQVTVTAAPYPTLKAVKTVEAEESTDVQADTTLTIFGETDVDLQDALKVVAAHRQVDLHDNVDPAEDLAFKEFFDSEVHPDKSREWILS